MKITAKTVLAKRVSKKVAKARELEQQPADVRRSETEQFLREKRHFFNAA